MRDFEPVKRQADFRRASSTRGAEILDPFGDVTLDPPGAQYFDDSEIPAARSVQLLRHHERVWGNVVTVTTMRELVRPAHL